MKKLLLSASATALTLGLGILLIWTLAPARISRGGVPADIRLVKVDEKVPPFYEHVFAHDNPSAAEYHGYKLYLPDPRLVHRAMPLLPRVVHKGPHDVLGFRNTAVLNRYDVIVMGDSQTYGANVDLEESWPSQLAALLTSQEKKPTVYNVSLGGWSVVHYYYLFDKILAFDPKVVVIAHYMGNDSIECFRLAYSIDFYADLIPDSTLTSDDLADYPPEEPWRVEYKDRKVDVFEPEKRLFCNARLPVVNAGYQIMKEASRRISLQAEEKGIFIVYTIIPTRETAAAKKLASEKIVPPQAYADLVRIEQERIEDLGDFLGRLPNSKYVDVVSKLQKAMMGPASLYPFAVDEGHPIKAGYAVISEAVAPAVRSLLYGDSAAPLEARTLKLSLKANSQLPVLHLTFDDATESSIVADVSGTGWNQLLRDANGDPSTSSHSVPGVVGNALSFDGVDDSIEIPAEQADEFFSAGQDFTVAFWWSSNTNFFPNGYRRIIQRFSKDRGGIILFQRGNEEGLYRRIYLNVYAARTGPLLSAHTDSKDNLGKWHHYVYQRQGSVLRVWRDGKMLEESSGQTAAEDFGGGEPLVLGVPGEGVKGAIDDFRVYNRSLSEREIGALAQVEDKAKDKQEG